MESPGGPKRDGGWNSFKTIGEARGDDKPDSLIASVLCKIALLIAFVAGALFCVGLVLLRALGNAGYDFHSKSAKWALGGVVLITVISATCAWGKALIEEARTRKESRRSRSE